MGDVINNAKQRTVRFVVEWMADVKTFAIQLLVNVVMGMEIVNISARKIKTV